MGALMSCCRGLCGDSGGNENYQTIGGTSGGKSQVTPDPEERRKQLAEAAEKRRQEQERRGVKDVEAVRRMQERTRQREEAEEERARQGHRSDDGALQWTVT